MKLSSAAEPAVDKLIGWVETAVKMLPNLIVAIVFFFLFWLLSIGVGRLVNRLVLRLSSYHHVARLMASLSRLVVISVGVLLALNALNLDRTVASMLAGIGIVGLALGLAAKDTGGDYLAGLFIHFGHPFRTGHLIQVGNFMGYVESLELRVTRIINQQGQSVIIPNRKIADNELINYTITGKRRVDLRCGISYEADLRKAEELAIKAVDSLEIRNSEQAVELFYEDFGESAINFTLRFWTTPDQKTYLTARSQAIKAIRQAFKDHGIAMPYQNSLPVDISNFDLSKVAEGLRQQSLGKGRSLSAPQEAEPERDRGQDAT